MTRLLAILLVLVPSPIAAAQYTIDVARLHSGYFATGTSPALPDGSTCSAVRGCNVTVPAAGNALEFAAGAACDAVFRVTGADLPTVQLECTPAGGAATAVQVSFPTPDPSSLDITAQSVTIDRRLLSANTTFRVLPGPPAPARWQRLQGAAPDEIANLTSGALVVLASTDGGRTWTQATVRDLRQGGGGQQAAGARGAGGPGELNCDEDAEAWCRSALPTGVAGACYVDVVGRDLRLVLQRPANHILAPNAEFRVVVRHRTTRSIEASLSGSIATTEPTIDRANGSTTAGGETLLCSRTTASFGPRRAGQPLELSVQLRESGTTLDTEHLELVVEQRYWGALRIGVGIPFIAVDRSYTAERVGGSLQPEIVSRGSDLDVELITAFAAYFDGLASGRSYVEEDFAHFGIFAAAGILASSERGAQFLTSFYLGLEWEPMRSFTVGAAAVIRRVQRLTDGYRVGDAVMDGATLSGESWAPGFALVVCVSPEFLQFAGGIGGGSQ